MRFAIKLSILFIFIFPFRAYSHGEEKPGPHGGHIRMPGAFHTELSVRKGSVRVYLLDVNLRNPTTAESEISVSLKQGSRDIPLQCKAKTKFFDCSAPQGVNLDSGTLTVIAKRASISGGAVVYKLPLKFAH